MRTRRTAVSSSACCTTGRGASLTSASASCAARRTSYTGEETVELQCHGSPAMLAAGLEALLAAGARQAGPGEFTRRAFLNGKLDLTQAEAVIDLIDAETADAAANAAGQLGGALKRAIEPVYDGLTDLCSHFTPCSTIRTRTSRTSARRS